MSNLQYTPLKRVPRKWYMSNSFLVRSHYAQDILFTHSIEIREQKCKNSLIHVTDIAKP